MVEVGVDADRDREFRDDALLKLYSDRQAEILLKPLNANGTLRFETAVSDFKVHVPGGSLQNARVNLLARVQAGGWQQWSESVEVILDQSGPRVDQIRLFPDRVAVDGSELEVHVWGGDDQLSGIASVQVGFDVERDGEFSEQVAPVPAERGEFGAWIAKLPVNGVELGPVTLLVQATDAVGNTSEIAKIGAEVISEEQATARRDAAVNRVIGTAVYGGVPVPNTEVTLEGEVKLEPVRTNDQGRFVFVDVPPGTYKLFARGVARNRPRKIEIADVEVLPAPAKATSLQLELK